MVSLLSSHVSSSRSDSPLGRPQRRPPTLPSSTGSARRAQSDVDFTRSFGPLWQMLEQWPQKALVLLTLYLIIPSPPPAPARPTGRAAPSIRSPRPTPSADTVTAGLPSRPPPGQYSRALTSAKSVVQDLKAGASEVEAILTLVDEGERKTSEPVGPGADEGGPAPHSRLLRKQTESGGTTIYPSTGYSTPPLSLPPTPLPSPLADPPAAPLAGTPLAPHPPAADDPDRMRTSSDPGRKPSTEENVAPPPSRPAPNPCHVDERGRSVCPGSPRTPLSLATRRNELADAAHEFGSWLVALAGSAVYNTSFSPFTITLLLFHLLLAVQAASAQLEDLIIRTDLGAPPLAKFPRGATLGKRVSRGSWKLRKAVWRHGRAMLGLLGLAIGVGVVGCECWARGAGRGMWEDAPFERWLLPDVQAGAVKAARAGRSPFRELVLLEVSHLSLLNLTRFRSMLMNTRMVQSINTAVVLLQAGKHLLPASILPPTVSIPAFLLDSHESSPTLTTRNSRVIRLESVWLLEHALLGLSTLIGIVQAVVLLFLLPSYSPLTLPPHLLFHRMRARGKELARLKSDLVRTVECLETVLRTFPRAGAEGCGKAEEEGEDEYVCTICFEGAAEGGEAGRTANLACRLGCGHQCKFSALALFHLFGMNWNERADETVTWQTTLAVSYGGCTTSRFAQSATSPCPILARPTRPQPLPHFISRSISSHR